MEAKVTARNPKDFATNSVRYLKKDGKHVVIHYMHCGEDIAPDIFRFKRFADAWIKWGEILDIMIDRGYTEMNGEFLDNKEV